MKSYEELNGSIRYKGGILHIKHNHNIELNERNMQFSIFVQRQYTRGDKYCLLIDLRGNITFTEGAVKLSSRNPDYQNIKCCAVIVDKGASRAGAKLHVLIEKPNIITENFLSEKGAREWIAGFM